jgi:hypothetical protein
MAQEIVYTLTVEVEGQYESEGVVGEKGAGEGLKQLEKEIRQMNFAASNTDIRTKSLVKV